MNPHLEEVQIFTIFMEQEGESYNSKYFFSSKVATFEARNCCFSNIALNHTVWKVSMFGVILVRIFPHSGWIRRNTPYLSVSPNMFSKQLYWGGLETSGDCFEAVWKLVDIYFLNTARQNSTMVDKKGNVMFRINNNTARIS